MAAALLLKVVDHFDQTNAIEVLGIGLEMWTSGHGAPSRYVTPLIKQRMGQPLYSGN